MADEGGPPPEEGEPPPEADASAEESVEQPPAEGEAGGGEEAAPAAADESTEKAPAGEGEGGESVEEGAAGGDGEEPSVEASGESVEQGAAGGDGGEPSVEASGEGDALDATAETTGEDGEGDAAAGGGGEGEQEAAEAGGGEGGEGSETAEGGGASEELPAAFEGEEGIEETQEESALQDSQAVDQTEGDISGIQERETTMKESQEGGDGSLEASQALDESAAQGSMLEGSEEELGASQEGGGELDESVLQQQGEAAVMIQSLARSKAARRRVDRIKAGDEDPFAHSPDTRGRPATGDARSVPEASEEAGEGGEEGGGEEGSGEEEVLSSEALEEEEARREREDRRRLEAEAKQAKVMEKIELSRKYAEALAGREKLAALNADLQKRLAAHYALKKSEEGGGQLEEQDQSSDLEQRYFQSLRQVADSRQELEKVQLNYDHIALDMKTRLEQKQDKVRELREGFAALKAEVAGGPGGAGTGRLIPPKLLRQFEEQERKKEEELEKVRLKNIHLRNQLRKLEGNLRRKEELSNELHLIDFEQLKIENQTLNEKIEERNEELLKLRKKTTTTVQVLTHLKEKLQFVQAENQLLKVELAELEAELSTHRDALTKAKHDRDSLRSDNLRLRGEAGLIGNNDLLRDFDRRKKEIAAMQVTLEGLKMRHRSLREHINEMGVTTEGGAQTAYF